MPSALHARSNRLRCAAALAALLGSAACTADRTGSLRAFGGWIRDDGKAFVRDIEDGPRWLGKEMSYEARDFVAASNFALQRTVRDARESKNIITGAPSWVAAESGRDLHRLSLDASDTWTWTREDAGRLAEDVAGGPAYLKRESRYEWRDLKTHVGILAEQARNEWNDLPTSFGRTLAILFLR